MPRDELASWIGNQPATLTLEDGAKVAVVGGGPAGSFFSYFLLVLPERVGTDIQVDLYEPKDYSVSGPKGCNKCGGIISESLVQMLAAEGIVLPPEVVQRGVDSYVLHTDVGSARIETPLNEKRIGAVHRGSGPRGATGFKWESFDKFLVELAVDRGARLIKEKAEKVSWDTGLPQIATRGGETFTYDLLVSATGVNSRVVVQKDNKGSVYKPPEATKTAIREYHLGESTVEEKLGSSMHIFLLDIPRLEFAALIPKGDYVTVCLLGQSIDKQLIETFLNAPEVRSKFPDDWEPDEPDCQCWPLINIGPAEEPFSDRLVYIGDSGVARLYKDGIGSAYRTAKAAATTAILQGVSAEMFRQHYWPVLEKIQKDNRIGSRIFQLTHLVQRRRFTRLALLRTVIREQRSSNIRKPMSLMLWDMFTGSAPYKEAIAHGMHPGFVFTFLWEILRSLIGPKPKTNELERR